MTAKRATLVTIIGFVICFKALAQESSLKLLAEVPLQFGIGYEGKISNRFSVALSAGVLTQPNSTLIVDVLDAFGTDDAITIMITDAFKFGVVGKTGVNYNFKRSYVGGFFEIIALQAGDTPRTLIESYFGTNVNSYPARRGRGQSNEVYLRLSSTLYQGGILYGRRFPLKNKQFEIDTEIAVSANLGSKSKLTSEYRDLATLSKEVDTELSGYYSSYGFVPSLAVAFVYKFNKQG